MSPSMNESMTRRTFLCVVAGCAAAAASGCSDFTHTSFFRENFRDMSPEELRRIIADLEREYSDAYGKSVTVGTKGAQPGIHFAYALDISRCIGCRRCVYACVDENNQSRDPQIQWIRVLEMEQDKGIDFHHADPYYDPDQVPQPKGFQPFCQLRLGDQLRQIRGVGGRRAGLEPGKQRIPEILFRHHVDPLLAAAHVLADAVDELGFGFLLRGPGLAAEHHDGFGLGDAG